MHKPSDTCSGTTAGPTGVLLVNLGTPAAPTRAAVRSFLAEFLADPDVVDLDPLLWWILRNGVVLPLRSGRVAATYRRIWTPEGPPLLAEARRLRGRLAGDLGPGYRVALGMRYGSPSIRRGLVELLDEGCDPVIVVPLFPQYSRSTTGSIEGELERLRADLPADLDLRVVPPCFRDPLYLRALAERVREAMGPGPVDHVVMSFHGLPARYVARGDPYQEQCEATAKALAEELGLARSDWSLVWQSRFGPGEWLEPQARDAVSHLASSCKRILVVCPGFAADCLETLEEIGIRLREAFLRAGGLELRLATALNDQPTWSRCLAQGVRAAASPPRALA